MQYKLSDLPDLERKAKTGDVESQRKLADVYYDFVEDELSFKWAAQAAANGDKRARYLCGCAYLDGRGVEKNIEKACQTFEEGISEGDDWGYLGMGLYYEEVEKDYERALAFYQESDAYGNYVAKARIAWMYQKGIGVKKDLYKAVQLYTDLSEKGEYNYSNEQLYLIYDGQEEEFMEDASKADIYLLKAAEGGASWCEIQEAYKCKFNGDMAGYIRWLTSAADHAHPEAMISLGREYLSGENVPENTEKAGWLLENSLYYAKKWKDEDVIEYSYDMLDSVICLIYPYVSQEIIDELISRDSVNALLVVAEKYRTGEGVPVDIRKAVGYMEKAAAAGSDIAQSELAEMYIRGEGVSKNIDKAVSLAESAVRINDEKENVFVLAYAYHELLKGNPSHAVQGLEKLYPKIKDKELQIVVAWDIGTFYIDNYKNYEKAVRYLQDAASAGHEASQHLLGLLYYGGRGVKADIMTAREWWEKAAAQGNTESARLLRETASQVPKKAGSFFKKFFS